MILSVFPDAPTLARPASMCLRVFIKGGGR